MEAQKKDSFQGAKGSQSIVPSSLAGIHRGRSAGTSRLAAVLLALIMISWCMSVVSADEMWVTANGELTAIEEDGRVIINNGGYFLEPQVRVLNARRIRCSVKDLKLPAAILFEYYYTSKGPIIRSIKELPR